MSLRSTCIEAMAASAPAWLTRNAEPIWVDALCVLHLDALLGVLEEHADEWRKAVNSMYGGFAGGYFPPGTNVSISGVEIENWLAVLREDT